MHTLALGLRHRKKCTPDVRTTQGGARSTVDLLIGALPAAPVITVKSAAALVGRSEQAVNEAIPPSRRSGRPDPDVRSVAARAFAALDLIDAFTELERRLASPEGDRGTGARSDGRLAAKTDLHL